jgi:sulfite exporter TauE/SafE
LIDSSLSVLLSSAIGIGVAHSVIGVDHWLPFIVLGRARHWSLQQVLALTAACGFGHILTSFALGFVGIGLGAALADVQGIEQSRGHIAGWLMIAFGLTYAAWSFARGRRQQAHAHSHVDGMVHAEEECEGEAQPSKTSGAMTAGGLFLIFAMGPSEPLIPLLMVPALDFGMASAVAVGLAYGLATLATMLAAVTVGFYGLQMPSFHGIEKHAHTAAGLAIAASGLLMHLLDF